MKCRLSNDSSNAEHHRFFSLNMLTEQKTLWKIGQKKCHSVEAQRARLCVCNLFLIAILKPLAKFVSTKKSTLLNWENSNCHPFYFHAFSRRIITTENKRGSKEQWSPWRGPVKTAARRATGERFRLTVSSRVRCFIVCCFMNYRGSIYTTF